MVKINIASVQQYMIDCLRVSLTYPKTPEEVEGLTFKIEDSGGTEYSDRFKSIKDSNPVWPTPVNAGSPSILSFDIYLKTNTSLDEGEYTFRLFDSTGEIYSGSVKLKYMEDVRVKFRAPGPIEQKSLSQIKVYLEPIDSVNPIYNSKTFLKNMSFSVISNVSGTIYSSNFESLSSVIDGLPDDQPITEFSISLASGGVLPQGFYDLRLTTPYKSRTFSVVSTLEDYPLGVEMPFLSTVQPSVGEAKIIQKIVMEVDAEGNQEYVNQYALRVIFDHFFEKGMLEMADRRIRFTDDSSGTIVYGKDVSAWFNPDKISLVNLSTAGVKYVTQMDIPFIDEHYALKKGKYTIDWSWNSEHNKLPVDPVMYTFKSDWIVKSVTDIRMFLADGVKLELPKPQNIDVWENGDPANKISREKYVLEYKGNTVEEAEAATIFGDIEEFQKWRYGTSSSEYSTQFVIPVIDFDKIQSGSYSFILYHTVENETTGVIDEVFDFIGTIDIIAELSPIIADVQQSAIDKFTITLESPMPISVVNRYVPTLLDKYGMVDFSDRLMSIEDSNIWDAGMVETDTFDVLINNEHPIPSGEYVFGLKFLGIQASYHIAIIYYMESRKGYIQSMVQTGLNSVLMTFSETQSRQFLMNLRMAVKRTDENDRDYTDRFEYLQNILKYDYPTFDELELTMNHEKSTPAGRYNFIFYFDSNPNVVPTTVYSFQTELGFMTNNIPKLTSATASFNDETGLMEIEAVIMNYLEYSLFYGATISLVDVNNPDVDIINKFEERTSWRIITTTIADNRFIRSLVMTIKHNPEDYSEVVEKVERGNYKLQFAWPDIEYLDPISYVVFVEYNLPKIKLAQVASFNAANKTARLYFELDTTMQFSYFETLQVEVLNPSRADATSVFDTVQEANNIGPSTPESHRIPRNNFNLNMTALDQIELGRYQFIFYHMNEGVRESANMVYLDMSNSTSPRIALVEQVAINRLKITLRNPIPWYLLQEFLYTVEDSHNRDQSDKFLTIDRGNSRPQGSPGDPSYEEWEREPTSEFFVQIKAGEYLDYGWYLLTMWNGSLECDGYRFYIEERLEGANGEIQYIKPITLSQIQVQFTEEESSKVFENLELNVYQITDEGTKISNRFLPMADSIKKYVDTDYFDNFKIDVLAPIKAGNYNLTFDKIFNEEETTICVNENFYLPFLSNIYPKIKSVTAVKITSMRNGSITYDDALLITFSPGLELNLFKVARFDIFRTANMDERVTHMEDYYNTDTSDFSGYRSDSLYDIKSDEVIMETEEDEYGITYVNSVAIPFKASALFNRDTYTVYFYWGYHTADPEDPDDITYDYSYVKDLTMDSRIDYILFPIKSIEQVEGSTDTLLVTFNDKFPLPTKDFLVNSKLKVTTIYETELEDGWDATEVDFTNEFLTLEETNDLSALESEDTVGSLVLKMGTRNVVEQFMELTEEDVESYLGKRINYVTTPVRLTVNNYNDTVGKIVGIANEREKAMLNTDNLETYMGNFIAVYNTKIIATYGYINITEDNYETYRDRTMSLLILDSEKLILDASTRDYFMDQYVALYDEDTHETITGYDTITEDNYDDYLGRTVSMMEVSDPVILNSITHDMIVGHRVKVYETETSVDVVVKLTEENYLDYLGMTVALISSDSVEVLDETNESIYVNQYVVVYKDPEAGAPLNDLEPIDYIELLDGNEFDFLGTTVYVFTDDGSKDVDIVELDEENISEYYGMRVAEVENPIKLTEDNEEEFYDTKVNIYNSSKNRILGVITINKANIDIYRGNYITPYEEKTPITLTTDNYREFLGAYIAVYNDNAQPIMPTGEYEFVIAKTIVDTDGASLQYAYGGKCDIELMISADTVGADLSVESTSYDTLDIRFSKLQYTDILSELIMQVYKSNENGIAITDYSSAFRNVIESNTYKYHTKDIIGVRLTASNVDQYYGRLVGLNNAPELEPAILTPANVDTYMNQPIDVYNEDEKTDTFINKITGSPMVIGDITYPRDMVRVGYPIFAKLKDARIIPPGYYLVNYLYRGKALYHSGVVTLPYMTSTPPAVDDMYIDDLDGRMWLVVTFNPKFDIDSFDKALFRLQVHQGFETLEDGSIVVKGKDITDYFDSFNNVNTVTEQGMNFISSAKYRIAEGVILPSGKYTLTYDMSNTRFPDISYTGGLACVSTTVAKALTDDASHIRVTLKDEIRWGILKDMEMNVINQQGEDVTSMFLTFREANPAKEGRTDEDMLNEFMVEVAPDQDVPTGEYTFSISTVLDVDVDDEETAISSSIVWSMNIVWLSTRFAGIYRVDNMTPESYTIVTLTANNYTQYIGKLVTLEYEYMTQREKLTKTNYTQYLDQRIKVYGTASLDKYTVSFGSAEAPELVSASLINALEVDFKHDSMDYSDLLMKPGYGTSFKTYARLKGISISLPRYYSGAAIKAFDIDIRMADNTSRTRDFNMEVLNNKFVDTEKYNELYLPLNEDVVIDEQDCEGLNISIIFSGNYIRNYSTQFVYTYSTMTDRMDLKLNGTNQFILPNAYSLSFYYYNEPGVEGAKPIYPFMVDETYLPLLAGRLGSIQSIETSGEDSLEVVFSNLALPVDIFDPKVMKLVLVDEDGEDVNIEFMSLTETNGFTTATTLNDLDVPGTLTITVAPGETLPAGIYTLKFQTRVSSSSAPHDDMYTLWEKSVSLPILYNPLENYISEMEVTGVNSLKLKFDKDIDVSLLRVSTFDIKDNHKGATYTDLFKPLTETNFFGLHLMPTDRRYIMYSSDGISWSRMNTGFDYSFTKVFYHAPSKKYFALCTNGHVLQIGEMSSSSSATKSVVDFNKIIEGVEPAKTALNDYYLYDDGTLVLVGNNASIFVGTINANGDLFLYKKDPLAYEGSEDPAVMNGSLTSVTLVCDDLEEEFQKLVAVGYSGTAFESHDKGQTWYELSVNGSSSDFMDVYYYSHEYTKDIHHRCMFVVGSNGAIFRTANLLSPANILRTKPLGKSTEVMNEWRNINTTKTIYGVASHEGLLVFVGEGGLVLYATEGEDRFYMSYGEMNDTFTLRDVVYAESKFIASGVNGKWITSLKGKKWSINNSMSSTATLKSAAYVPSQYGSTKGSYVNIELRTNQELAAINFYSGTSVPTLSSSFCNTWSNSEASLKAHLNDIYTLLEFSTKEYKNVFSKYYQFLYNEEEGGYQWAELSDEDISVPHNGYYVGGLRKKTDANEDWYAQSKVETPLPYMTSRLGEITGVEIHSPDDTEGITVQRPYIKLLMSGASENMLHYSSFSFVREDGTDCTKYFKSMPYGEISYGSTLSMDGFIIYANYFDMDNLTDAKILKKLVDDGINNAEYTEILDPNGASPMAKLWYEVVDGKYELSEDLEPVAGKTYYRCYNIYLKGGYYDLKWWWTASAENNYEEIKAIKVKQMKPLIDSSRTQLGSSIIKLVFNAELPLAYIIGDESYSPATIQINKTPASTVSNASEVSTFNYYGNFNPFDEYGGEDEDLSYSPLYVKEEYGSKFIIAPPIDSNDISAKLVLLDTASLEDGSYIMKFNNSTMEPGVKESDEIIWVSCEKIKASTTMISVEPSLRNVTIEKYGVEKDLTKFFENNPGIKRYNGNYAGNGIPETVKAAEYIKWSENENTLKAHCGDKYTNALTGDEYTFYEENGIYSWHKFVTKPHLAITFDEMPDRKTFEKEYKYFELYGEKKDIAPASGGPAVMERVKLNEYNKNYFMNKTLDIFNTLNADEIPENVMVLTDETYRAHMESSPDKYVSIKTSDGPEIIELTLNNCPWYYTKFVEVFEDRAGTRVSEIQTITSKNFGLHLGKFVHVITEVTDQIVLMHDYNLRLYMNKGIKVFTDETHSAVEAYAILTAENYTTYNNHYVELFDTETILPLADNNRALFLYQFVNIFDTDDNFKEVTVLDEDSFIVYRNRNMKASLRTHQLGDEYVEVTGLNKGYYYDKGVEVYNKNEETGEYTFVESTTISINRATAYIGKYVKEIPAKVEMSSNVKDYFLGKILNVYKDDGETIDIVVKLRNVDKEEFPGDTPAEQAAAREEARRKVNELISEIEGKKVSEKLSSESGEEAFVYKENYYSIEWYYNKPLNIYDDDNNIVDVVYMTSGITQRVYDRKMGVRVAETEEVVKLTAENRIYYQGKTLQVYQDDKTTKDRLINLTSFNYDTYKNRYISIIQDTVYDIMVIDGDNKNYFIDKDVVIYMKDSDDKDISIIAWMSNEIITDYIGFRARVFNNDFMYVLDSRTYSYSLNKAAKIYSDEEGTTLETIDFIDEVSYETYKGKTIRLVVAGTKMTLGPVNKDYFMDNVVNVYDNETGNIVEIIAMKDEEVYNSHLGKTVSLRSMGDSANVVDLVKFEDAQGNIHYYWKFPKVDGRYITTGYKSIYGDDAFGTVEITKDDKIHRIYLPLDDTVNFPGAEHVTFKMHFYGEDYELDADGIVVSGPEKGNHFSYPTLIYEADSQVFPTATKYYGNIDKYTKFNPKVQGIEDGEPWPTDAGLRIWFEQDLLKEFVRKLEISMTHLRAREETFNDVSYMDLYSFIGKHIRIKGSGADYVILTEENMAAFANKDIEAYWEENEDVGYRFKTVEAANIEEFEDEEYTRINEIRLLLSEGNMIDHGTYNLKLYGNKPVSDMTEAEKVIATGSDGELEYDDDGDPVYEEKKITFTKRVTVPWLTTNPPKRFTTTLEFDENNKPILQMDFTRSVLPALSSLIASEGNCSEDGRYTLTDQTDERKPFEDVFYNLGPMYDLNEENQLKIEFDIQDGSYYDSIEKFVTAIRYRIRKGKALPDEAYDVFLQFAEGSHLDYIPNPKKHDDDDEESTLEPGTDSTIISPIGQFTETAREVNGDVKKMIIKWIPQPEYSDENALIGSTMGAALGITGTNANGTGFAAVGDGWQQVFDKCNLIISKNDVQYQNRFSDASEGGLTLGFADHSMTFTLAPNKVVDPGYYYIALTYDDQEVIVGEDIWFEGIIWNNHAECSKAAEKKKMKNDMECWILNEVAPDGESHCRVYSDLGMAKEREARMEHLNDIYEYQYRLCERCRSIKIFSTRDDEPNANQWQVPYTNDPKNTGAKKFFKTLVKNWYTYRTRVASAHPGKELDSSFNPNTDFAEPKYAVWTCPQREDGHYMKYDGSTMTFVPSDSPVYYTCEGPENGVTQDIWGREIDQADSLSVRPFPGFILEETVAKQGEEEFYQLGCAYYTSEGKKYTWDWQMAEIADGKKGLPQYGKNMPKYYFTVFTIQGNDLPRGFVANKKGAKSSPFKKSLKSLDKYIKKVKKSAATCSECRTATFMSFNEENYGWIDILMPLEVWQHVGASQARYIAVNAEKKNKAMKKEAKAMKAYLKLTEDLWDVMILLPAVFNQSNKVGGYKKVKKVTKTKKGWGCKSPKFIWAKITMDVPWTGNTTGRKAYTMLTCQNQVPEDDTLNVDEFEAMFHGKDAAIPAKTAKKLAKDAAKKAKAAKKAAEKLAKAKKALDDSKATSAKSDGVILMLNAYIAFYQNAYNEAEPTIEKEACVAAFKKLKGYSEPYPEYTSAEISAEIQKSSDKLPNLITTVVNTTNAYHLDPTDEKKQAMDDANAALNKENKWIEDLTKVQKSVDAAAKKAPKKKGSPTKENQGKIDAANKDKNKANADKDKNIDAIYKKYAGEKMKEAKCCSSAWKKLHPDTTMTVVNVDITQYGEDANNPTW